MEVSPRLWGLASVFHVKQVWCAEISRRNDSAVLFHVKQPGGQRAEDAWNLFSSMISIFTSNHRLNKLTYPNGRTLHYGYGQTTWHSHTLGVVHEILDDDGSGSAGSTLIRYGAKFGVATITEFDYEEPDLRNVLHGGDSDEDVEGWDRADSIPKRNTGGRSMTSRGGWSIEVVERLRSQPEPAMSYNHLTEHERYVIGHLNCGNGRMKIFEKPKDYAAFEQVRAETAGLIDMQRLTVTQ